jgi:hypothetical protein
MIDHSVLCSSKDHLRTGTYDLDHPISCRCKKRRQLACKVGVFAARFSSGRSDGSLISARRCH